jgi:hypothetical protein
MQLLDSARPAAAVAFACLVAALAVAATGAGAAGTLVAYNL